MNILTIGDSNGASEHGWVVQLEKLRPSDTIYNVSVSGNTIGFDNLGQERLNTLSNVGDYLKEAVQAMSDIDVIIILLGTNDAKKIFEEQKELVPANLETLVNTLKTYPFAGNHSPQILVVSPPPYGPDKLLADKYHGGASRVEYFSREFGDIAQKTNVCYLNIHRLLKKDFMEYSTDGVHLTGSGQKLIAGAISQKLDSMKKTVIHR